MRNTQFRLRIEDQIVGFMRSLKSGAFYSKDGYAWVGAEIQYEIIDPCLGLTDLNQNTIYANDILEVKHENKTTQAFVVFDEALKQFILFSVDGEDVLADDAELYLRNTSFRRIAYTFQQLPS